MSEPRPDLTPELTMPEETGARQGIGLIDLIANLGEVRAAGNEFRADVKGAGARAGVLK